MIRKFKTWVTYRIAHVLVAMCGGQWTKGTDPDDTPEHDDS